ncbi:MAG: glucose 1-dehydrogenase [Dehalococcoidia bacterium]|nr:glucose 1-dehydrogenase [Dehalococcoidia bacterium]
MDRLKDQVLIVTGGAHGIGLAYCEGLAAEGARVVVADIDGQGADAVAASLGEAGHDALAVTTDVSQPESTDTMARLTMERFGRIDGIINNAAIYQRPAVTRGPFEEIPVEEWDRLMGVNLRGVFLCCRAVVPHMKAQGSGKIVNISSGTVFNGSTQMLHYVTSKAGVIGLTRSLARELGDYNINVNAIAPGLTVSMDDDDEDKLLRFETRMQARSLKRLEGPQDLVGAVLFLCSTDSDFMTGQTMVVDGGAQMH